jgi:ATP-binding cassette subfamily B multidrug efflux pump
MAQVTGKALDWKLLGRIMHYVKPYNRTFIIAALLTIFLAVIALAQPILMQKALDDCIMTNNYDKLLLMVCLMIGLLAVQTAAQYYQTFMTISNPRPAYCDL